MSNPLPVSSSHIVSSHQDLQPQIRLKSNTDSIGFSINSVGTDFEITAVTPGSIAAVLNFRVGDRVSSLNYLVQVGGDASKTLLDYCATKYLDKPELVSPIEISSVVDGSNTRDDSTALTLVHKPVWRVVVRETSCMHTPYMPVFRVVRPEMSNRHTPPLIIPFVGHEHNTPYMPYSGTLELTHNISYYSYLEMFEEIVHNMPCLKERLNSLIEQCDSSEQDISIGCKLLRLLQLLRQQGYSEQILVKAVELLVRLLHDSELKTAWTNFLNILQIIEHVSYKFFSDSPIRLKALTTFLENSDLLIHLQRNGGLNPKSLNRLLRATRDMMILVRNDIEQTKLSKLLPKILLLQRKYPHETAEALAIKIERYCNLHSLLVEAKQSLVEANKSLKKLSPGLYRTLAPCINAPLQKADFFVPHLFDPFHYDQDITQAEHRSVWVSDLATLNTTISELVSKMPTQSSRFYSELNLISSKWIDFNKKVSQAISITQNRGSSVQQLTY